MTVVDEAREALRESVFCCCAGAVCSGTTCDLWDDVGPLIDAYALTVHIESCTKFDERTNTPCSPHWHCETALQYLPKKA